MQEKAFCELTDSDNGEQPSNIPRWTEAKAACNMGIAASGAGRCINGHFIAINISRAGQASLGFCLLTFSFISLFSSGSGQDEQ